MSGERGLSERQLRTFRRMSAAAGIENLAIFAPVALPGIYQRYYAMNNRLNRALRLGGDDGRPPEEGINKLFVNLTGILGSAMGLALLYAARDIRNRSGVPVVSAVARLVSVALIWYYVARERVARVMLLFTIPALIFSTAFLYYAKRLRAGRPKLER
ncbi:MAG: hypothetical protein M3P51_19010 [Chloroflexota bacterium]|nr:hypothetical protein [Chloroflexota bacterium]